MINHVFIRHRPVVVFRFAHTIAGNQIAPLMGAPLASGMAKCSLDAETFLSTWIAAGYPEDEIFEFTDVSGVHCQAIFEDLNVLFNETNLWYPGVSACIICHNANVTVFSARINAPRPPAGRGPRRRSNHTGGNTEIRAVIVFHY